MTVVNSPAAPVPAAAATGRRAPPRYLVTAVAYLLSRTPGLPVLIPRPAERALRGC